MSETGLPPYLLGLRDGPEAVLASGSGAFVDAAPPDPPAGTLREIEHRFSDELLDAYAVKVIRRLEEGGHSAYLVGGSVRDLLFGLRPKDFDIVTSALPNEIRRLFRNCRIIGRRFRLAHVYFRDKVLEVATFRAPMPASENGDGELLIRDDNVFGTREQDVMRRDITINALLYDVSRGVILDYVGGVADAEAHVLRMIGDPDIRMQEDPIRMLRVLRLAARLTCRIDRPTWEAVVRHRALILDAAKPRILEDLMRMFLGGAAGPAFDLMLESGVLEVVLPELHAHLVARLAAGDTEELESLRAVLRAADRARQQGREFTSAQRLSLLLAPLLLAPDGDGAKTAPAEQATERMKPIAARLAISRRDGERVRQIILSLPKLLGTGAPRKSRRRGGGGALVRRSYFREALEVFGLYVAATGDGHAEFERWAHRLAEIPAEEQAPPAPARSSRRRRSRRPRRFAGA